MNANKEKALRALLATNTLSKAAETAGIGTRTLYRYLHEDGEFMQRYAEEMANLMVSATETMKKGLSPAISRLLIIIKNDKMPPSVHVQACRTVIEYSLRLTEAQEVLTRLDALEKAQVDNHG